MAAFNVEIRQRVSGAFSDIIYPKAHWSNMDGKPATFAPTAHTHDIDDINATGTPSASNFLRGDGAWATPEGGSSGGLNVIVDTTLPSDTARITLANLGLQKGKVYNFEFILLHQINAPTYIWFNDLENNANYYTARFYDQRNAGTGYTYASYLYGLSYIDTGFATPSYASNERYARYHGSLYITDEGITYVRMNYALRDGNGYFAHVVIDSIWNSEVSSISQIELWTSAEGGGYKYKAGCRALIYEVV